MDTDSLLKFFEKFSTAFFSASITLGAFLLSMKTFIIQIIKKDAYDTKEYNKKIQDRLGASFKVDKYKPLSNLRCILTCTIYTSFITAILQVITALFPKPFHIYISLTSMTITFICVFIAIILVSNNLKELLKSKNNYHHHK